MSVKWEGNRGTDRMVEYEIRPGKRIVVDADGRKKEPLTWSRGQLENPPPEEECVDLWRRYQYAKGPWSKWGKVGAFDSEAAAKEHAEKL